MARKKPYQSILILKQARRAEPSAQLCDPTLRPAPDKPHPFRPPPAVSGFRSDRVRSEEHTSELQSQSNHVCPLLLQTKGAADVERLRGSIRIRHKIGRAH